MKYFAADNDDIQLIKFVTDHLVVELNLTSVEAPKAVSGLIYNGKPQTGVAEAEGFTVTNGKMTGAGTYTATATLKRGYMWSDKTTAPKQITWTIAKKPVAAPTASASGSGRSISVTSNSTYEYRINGGAWQSSSTFDGLNPETNYTVEVRVKETANTKASEITKLTVNSGKTQHQKVSGPFLKGLVNAITVVVKTVMKLTWLFG